MAKYTLDIKFCDYQVESFTDWVEKEIVWEKVHGWNCVMYETRFCKDTHAQFIRCIILHKVVCMELVLTGSTSVESCDDVPFVPM